MKITDMNYICCVINKYIPILTLVVMFFFGASEIHAQRKESSPDGYIVAMCIYKGDTIPCVQLPQVYIFKPLVFKNEKQRKEYDRMVYNVKKTLPYAKIIRSTLIETYEYLQTLPDEKERKKHISRVEKGLKQQYTPEMKKLSFSQGKMLIKLVDRECNQSSYELVRAFMGSFKAGFYQTFAGLFGASLKKEYDPQGADQMIERIAILVENGQL